jgi:hypothetical protein
VIAGPAEVPRTNDRPNRVMGRPRCGFRRPRTILRWTATRLPTVDYPTHPPWPTSRPRPGYAPSPSGWPPKPHLGLPGIRGELTGLGYQIGASPTTTRRPRTVTADRGYGEAAGDNDLHELGVRTVVIPRKGKPGKARQVHEHRPAFRRTVKWRTGSEARISTLERQYGWDRSRLDDLDGARIWTGHGVLAHNLVKIATLAA